MNENNNKPIVPMHKLYDLFKGRTSLNGADKTHFRDVTESIYENFDGIRFSFRAVNYRFPEWMSLTVSVPKGLLAFSQEDLNDPLCCEDFVLRSIHPFLSRFAESLKNDNKETRNRGELRLAGFDSRVLRRSFVRYEGGFFHVSLFCRMPLLGISRIEGKHCIRFLKGILQTFSDLCARFSLNGFPEERRVCREYREILTYLHQNGYCCFIGNGTVIARGDSDSEPLRDAVPFVSPGEDEITVPLSDGSTRTGMGIRKGVTVITGGGYSGKTTLLDGIESGIYPHIPGDGREYIVTDHTALKAYAEDGRIVNNLNLSPFFKDNFLNQKVSRFHTGYASGSVSQAANITEGLYAGSKLLLVDEDKSATNFLTKDALIRAINPNDPIIPFTDRIRELTETRDVSVIIVVGAVSSYFEYADTLLLAEHFTVRDVTGKLPIAKNTEPVSASNWTAKRYCEKAEGLAQCFFRTVSTENNRMIFVGNYRADVLPLSAIRSTEQLNSLACAMELLLSQTEDFEIREIAERITADIVSDDTRPRTGLERMLAAANRWYEEIRPIDVICCLSRMRGVTLRDG
ncbi:MAG: hypothetical protein J5643_10480 [Lachnospiraceae bacterium]|nr:hypothetical protein [Lachnospiraceae bacterium]